MTCDRTLEQVLGGTAPFADEEGCVVDQAIHLMAAVRRGQCGTGVFCRDASAQLHRILVDIQEGRAKPDDLDLITEIATHMRMLSGCDLAVKTAQELLNVLESKRTAWEAHVRRKRCPAGVCPKLESGKPSGATAGAGGGLGGLKGGLRGGLKAGLKKPADG